MQSLNKAAETLAQSLERRALKIVFAESCTGGLVAASLAAIPGISRWLCGSAVTYQAATKAQWIGVSPEDLETYTAVSARVTRSMAKGVLDRTDQADLAVAVTGHLGPDAPQELDGRLFVVAQGRSGRFAEPALHQAMLFSHSRPDRQIEAATQVLKLTAAWISEI